jgi:hypothetical protein
MVSYDFTDRITSLEKDRKQMQTTLENLQYAMTMFENQLNNNCNGHSTQIKEVYDKYYIVTVLGILMFLLFVKYY